MEILRTPDERFSNLPDYPFEPHFLELYGLWVHYLDLGPRNGPVVLLLHGVPTWSYLFRHMIPPLAEAGCRVIAPDLVGFGKSDKPVRREDYTYDRMVRWTRAILDALGLDQITLFCQDWGGLIGLRLVAAQPERFSAVVASNTALPAGGPVSPAFLRWLERSQNHPELPIGRVITTGTVNPLPPEVLAAYEAPFPDERYKAGVRALPALVPLEPHCLEAQANRAAWLALARFHKPFLTVFGAQDRVTLDAQPLFEQRIPGAQGKPHLRLEGAGHFIQEDRSPALVEAILSLLS